MSQSSTQRRRKKGAHSVPHLPLHEAERNIDDQTRWSNIRKRAWSNRKARRNGFLYRFNGKWNEEKQDFDLEPTHTGPWSEEEHKLFMRRMKEFGVNHKWGIFSTFIPGRCGYICSNYWKSLIKKGFVCDASYIYDDKKKVWCQYKKIPHNFWTDYQLRYAFEIHYDSSGIWHNLPQKHPKYPTNVQHIIQEIKQKIKKPNSSQRSKAALNEEKKCDERGSESEIEAGTEEDIENDEMGEIQKCGECNLIQPGKMDTDNDIFYCHSCWNNYDTQRDESRSETESRSNSEANLELRRSKRKEAQKNVNYVDPDTDDEDEDDEEDEEDNDSVANTNSSLSQLIVSKVSKSIYHAASDGDDENSSDLSTIKPSKIRHKKRNRIISDDEEEKEEEENNDNDNDNDKELDDIDIESEQQTLLSLQYEEEQEGIVSVTVDNESVLNGGHDLGETQRDDEIAMDVDDIASSHHDHMNSNNEEEIDGDCDNNRDISIDTVTVNDNNNNQREIGRKRRREEVDDDNNNGDGLNEDRISKKRKTNDNLEILYKLQEIIENDTKQKERIKELEDVNEENEGRIKELEISKSQLLRELKDGKRSNIEQIEEMRKKMEENDKIKNNAIIELENFKKDLKLNMYQFFTKYKEFCQ